jgi:hypothetical protein
MDSMGHVGRGGPIHFTFLGGCDDGEELKIPQVLHPVCLV